MRKFIGGLVGGLIGSALFQFIQFHSTDAAADGGKIIQAQSFQLVDSSGKLKGQFATNPGGVAALAIYDNNLKPRVDIGMYPDQTAYVVLNDKNMRAIQILRSFGPSESPLHIFKTEGNDMMITGLNPTGAPTPFLMYYDSSRKRVSHFGKYEGP